MTSLLFFLAHKQRLVLAFFVLFTPFAYAWELDLHGIPSQSLALWAASVDSGDELVSWRADEAMSPASTMKLLTAWTALETLGPDHVWRTEFVSSAPTKNGTLNGNLYWIGRGDPQFRIDNLRDLLRQLKLRGIERIEGHLVLDKSAFNRITTAEGFEHDRGRAFMCPPDTHLLYQNSATSVFFIDEQGVRVVLDPSVSGLQLAAQLTPAALGSCDNVRDYVAISRPTAGQLLIKGKLPLSCDGAKVRIEEIMPPSRFAAETFYALWHEIGGTGPYKIEEGQAPSAARVLAVSHSPPLSRLLPDMVKYSQNPMSRLIYLSLGHTLSSRGDSVADAETVVRRTLRAHGIDDSALVLENGSGLSRQERLTAQVLGKVLLDVARGPYAAEFISSLPAAGQQGTLQQRFNALGARLRLKTGTLNGVRSLAGFWQHADGRRLAIVAIINDQDAAKQLNALDTVVRDVIDYFNNKP